jgi:hypothetical protein
VGNERYDAVAPSGNGVGSEVDGGHSKSSPGPPQRERPMLRIRRQRLTKPSDQPSRADSVFPNPPR